MQLTQAEEAFRASKSDLGMRPIYHHKEHRVQAHIFICFLALALWMRIPMKSEQRSVFNSDTIRSEATLVVKL
jgi:transposase